MTPAVVTPRPALQARSVSESSKISQPISTVCTVEDSPSPAAHVKRVSLDASDSSAAWPEDSKAAVVRVLDDWSNESTDSLLHDDSEDLMHYCLVDDVVSMDLLMDTAERKAAAAEGQQDEVDVCDLLSAAVPPPLEDDDDEAAAAALDDLFWPSSSFLEPPLSSQEPMIVSMPNSPVTSLEVESNSSSDNNRKRGAEEDAATEIESWQQRRAKLLACMEQTRKTRAWIAENCKSKVEEQPSMQKVLKEIHESTATVHGFLQKAETTTKAASIPTLDDE